ncbi:MAG: caspase family protein [Myxococcota bacterium]
MTDRRALLIGIDEFQGASPLSGARYDVIALAQALLHAGFGAEQITLVTHPPLPESCLPGVLRFEATTEEVRHQLARTAALADPDGTTLVHVSSRGLHSPDGPAVLTTDGTLSVRDLQAPFNDHPVRSVVFTIDVGFAGDPASSRSAAESLAPLPFTPRNPTVLAAGLDRPAIEITADGHTMGRLSWAFRAALRTVTPGQEWSFGALQRALSTLMSIEQVPVVVPATDMDRDLGPLLRPTAAHVPWRGVDAAFQFMPTHFTGPDGFAAGGPGTFEYFVVDSFPAMPPGQMVSSAMPGAPPTPPTNNTLRFTNNGFAATGSNAVPNVDGSDRVYEVTASWGMPGQVWVIARNGKADTQHMDWYTTAAGVPFLPAPGGTITLTEKSLPATWGGSTWFHVRNSRA